MDLKQLINRLKELSDLFCANGIEDIYTNSKIFEVLIAYQFGHQIINGHAYSSDAIDQDGNFYEYKHYKKSSSNHTWTFNDFTDETMKKLCTVKFVHFVVINDEVLIPQIEEIYVVPGQEVAEYMKTKTQYITNKRKMINISTRQIMDSMLYERIIPMETFYFAELKEVFVIAGSIEEIVKVNGILTSNKLWELLVACELDHYINPEQKQHDAYDVNGKTYEYKISTRPVWNFQDISSNVLASYRNDERIILAVVDKKAFIVQRMVACQPEAIIAILEKKLKIREENLNEVRRLTANIGIRDIEEMIESGEAEWVR